MNTTTTEQYSEAIKSFDGVAREDLIHLCIFLAGYQEALQGVRGKCMEMVGDEKARAWGVVVYEWPVMQGSLNQIRLVRIAELGYDAAAVSRAVGGAGKAAEEVAYRKAMQEGAGE